MAKKETLKKADPCAWIRKTYNVPAKVGTEVEIEGRQGVIVGGSELLLVLLQGDKEPIEHHPLDIVTYFGKYGLVEQITL